MVFPGFGAVRHTKKYKNIDKKISNCANGNKMGTNCNHFPAIPARISAKNGRFIKLRPQEAPGTAKMAGAV